MMTVELRYYTDTACNWSWATEPKLRRLLWEFGDDLAPHWVMGGLWRTVELADHARHLATWLEVSAESGMPCHPRVWNGGPISSSYPSCQAVRAACEQGPDLGYRYLRRLREGIFCERRTLDHAEALIAEAGPAGLDVGRFEIDLRSHAILEAFGADLEDVRDPIEAAVAAGKVRDLGGDKRRYALPSAVFEGDAGEVQGVFGPQPYEAYLLRRRLPPGRGSETSAGPSRWRRSSVSGAASRARSRSSAGARGPWSRPSSGQWPESGA